MTCYLLTSHYLECFGHFTHSGVILRWDRGHAREENLESPNVPIAADPAPEFGLSSPSQLCPTLLNQEGIHWSFHT